MRVFALTAASSLRISNRSKTTIFEQCVDLIEHDAPVVVCATFVGFLISATTHEDGSFSFHVSSARTLDGQIHIGVRDIYK